MNKKIYIMLGMTILLMVSSFVACNNDSPDFLGKLPIEIDASVTGGEKDKSSRVIKNDVDNRSITAFSEGDTIRVDMWRMPKGQGSSTSQPDIMRKQLMTYTGTDWDYSPKKFWSDSVGDRMAVFAYYLNGATNCVVHEDWDETSGYPTISFSNENRHRDILVSPVLILGKDGLENGKIPLTFYHVMARFEIWIRYWDDSVDDPGEWTSLYLEDMDFWNHPRGANFKGFDNEMVPQWEVTDYPTGKGVNVTGDKTIPWGEEYVHIPDATQFHYPFVCKHASAQDGHIDNAKFGLTVYKQNENGDRVNLTHDKNYFEKYFDTEIVGGCNYVFYITINPHNLVVLDIEKEDNSEAWWTGTHTDTNVTF